MVAKPMSLAFKLFLLILLWGSAHLQAADENSVVASINGEKITLKSIAKGSELEIYEAEQKLYQLRVEGLRRVLVSKLLRLDPRSKGMSDNDYLTRYVVNPRQISDAQVDAFIAERRIPQDKINTNLKEQARRFLVGQDISRQVDLWLAVQKDKHQVEVSLAEPKEPRFEVNIDNVAYRGGKDAKVTIVEFSDFECPYCVRVNETLLQLGKIYGDKIKVVYKHFPLSIHPGAEKAAEASLCAQEQGMDKFWLLHDKMFANQRNLSVGVIKDFAKELKLDSERFNQCLTSAKFAQQVADDISEGIALGVNSTPAFFINGRSIKGNLPLEFFRKVIDEELALNK